MSCCESDIAESEKDPERGRKAERRGGRGAGRDVNGGNVPDLLSCGS